ncbi:MAG: tRNA lysidine(34) synthetase TilS [Legionellales bacterium]|nr:tRNA lysidine(34) synthetase TilS [Legionellales bacterium]
MDVNVAIKDFLSALPTEIDSLYVALSGGLDSCVLLDALRVAMPNAPFYALHVHHGLSPFADDWVNHCEQLAQSLSVPLQVLRVNAKPAPGESPEAAARHARYEAFRMALPANSVLITAHHANDQAETLLLQLLRGAGVRGLSAMPVLAQFQNGWLARPFLSISRLQLEEYAELYQLSWINDESNLDSEIDRNYLRHQIVPLLTERWKGTVACLSRTANHCAEAEMLLSELAELDLSQVQSDSVAMNVLKLTQLSLPRIKNVLRYWIHRHGFLPPSTIKLQTIIDTVIYAAHDKKPCVTWEGAELRRFRDNLYVMKPLPPLDPNWSCDWDLKADLLLPASLGLLRVADYRDIANGQSLTVRFRRGGEVLYLGAERGHHTLKKLFQEWNIPPWLRSRTPLIFRGGELLRVVSYLSHPLA